MKIDIEFAILHAPLFLGGTNHGMKIQSGAKGVTMTYDDESDKLHIFFNGKVARQGGYETIVPFDSSVFGEAPKKKAQLTESGFIHTPSPAPRGKIKAQVGGPMDHVHAGPGAGKARN